MTIVASIFRDGESYVERYFEQIRWLRDLIPCTLHIAEGDSTDNTYPLLLQHIFAENANVEDTLYQIPHGGRKFESVDHPQRWNQIATVWNTLLDKLPQDGPLILVEADLIWDAPTMIALLGHLNLAGNQVDAVAPQSLKGGRFYDTWGYRWPSGHRLDSEPIIPSDSLPGLMQISSAGSCIVMRPEVYRDCRFGDNDGIVGFWRDAHFKGYSLYLDPNLKVEHP